MNIHAARLRSAFAALKERAGLCFYTKPQTYSVEYRVHLNNCSETGEKGSLVVPYPLHGSSQELVGEVLCSERIQVANDRCYGNRYGCIDIDLKPLEERIVVLRYACRVVPVCVDVGRNLPFEAYAALGDDAIGSYLTANRCVDSKNAEVIEIAQRFKTNGHDVVGTMKEINAYVIHRLKYGNPVPGLYTVEQALKEATVDCGGFDVLYCAIAMAAGIPSRVVSGFWAGYQQNAMHAWAESLLPDGTWVPVDPSVEQLRQEGRTSKRGRFGEIGSDRIALSVHCEIPVVIDGKESIVSLLQHPTYVSERGGSDTLSLCTEFFTTRV